MHHFIQFSLRDGNYSSTFGSSPVQSSDGGESSPVAPISSDLTFSDSSSDDVEDTLDMSSIPGSSRLMTYKSVGDKLNKKYHFKGNAK